MKLYLKSILLASVPLFASQASAQTISAAFRAAETTDNVYYSCGFDNDEEFATWSWKGKAASNYSWKMWAGDYVQPFNESYRETYNPSSVKSLLILQSAAEQDEIGTSPEVEVLPGTTLSFWLCCGMSTEGTGATIMSRYNFTVSVNDVDTREITTVFDGKDWIAKHTDYNRYHWTNVTCDLSQFSGRKIQIVIHYNHAQGPSGDLVFLDDIQLLQLSENMQVEVNQGEQVHFVNLSTVTGYSGQTKYFWEFLGGNPSVSTEANPVVTYNAEGEYDVRLTVSNVSATDSVGAVVERQHFVSVKVAAPVAAFDVAGAVYNCVGGGYLVPNNTPFTVTDCSTNYPTEWLWDFGTGANVQQSKEKSVVLMYPSEGKYDLSLTVANKAGNSTVGGSMQVGGSASYVWNIKPHEVSALSRLLVGTGEGFYGGSNTRRMDRFAEHFDKPLSPATIDKVGILFLSTQTYQPNANVEVTINAKGSDGMPGTVLATATLPMSNIKQTSQADHLEQLDLQAELTNFKFSKPVTVSDEFFVVVSGIPSYAMDPNTHAINSIYMASLLRENGGQNTSYVYRDSLETRIVNGQPMAGFVNIYKWEATSGVSVSFAIAPSLTLATVDTPPSGIVLTRRDEQGAEQYFDLRGHRLPAIPERGLYVVRRADGTVIKRVAHP